MASLPNPPSLIEYKGKKFLIFDAPNDDNLSAYIREFKKHNVLHVVRVCDPTYSTEPLKENGIQVTELAFSDGASPPRSVVETWLSLVKEVNKTANATIGIHCVAGLGRAPVLVAIALIESGMAPAEAVEFIRKRRRGAINTNQLRWLRQYKKNGCIVM
uniref:protein-tyrosine-phosphatase n=1 Tax=Vannella robusta TaxID=1487602 RepID=A0A7S4IMA3_9EUKA